ncbi:MAG: nucleoside-diphosphate sugar epimerase/dehydratase, partial [Motiliproteus sp.]
GREERLRIIDGLEKVEVAVRSVPSLDDIALGKADLADLYGVDMSDLLGRQEVSPDPALLARCVKTKSVMVTGAGGTIGSELCRQLLKLQPRQLILFEHSEFQLFSIEEEVQRRIKQFELEIDIVSVLGTVLDRGLVGNVLGTYNVDTVYHAAAYKHVPIVEHNVLAGVRNNVVGTYNLAIEAAIKGVTNFVLVSTDKAVRPTNTMGASKRLSEMVLQGLQNSTLNRSTCFSMVRFGNVLGSSGSVIPLFQQQISQGGPVTVTHPDITRYFMTIPEAALLVIQAGSMGKGGDLFVLDMGEPVKIAELARRMIRLAGYQVCEEGGNEGVRIEFTGLRHGEKLYEELLIGDNVQGTDHPLIMVADEEGPECDDISEFMEQLDGFLKQQNVVSIREFLLRYVSGYQPQCDIQDTLWLKMSQKGTDKERTVR